MPLLTPALPSGETYGLLAQFASPKEMPAPDMIMFWSGGPKR